MTAVIRSIGTAVPASRLAQSAIRDLFAAQEGTDRLTRRLIHAAFDAAAIDTRHTVIDELIRPGTAGGTFVGRDDRLLAPSTGTRNAVYRSAAPPLFAAAARDALDRAKTPASTVTHVVTVSCTGFFAPGPDFRLVRDLGIPASAERYHLGFMGCAAALPALRMAARLCDAQPGSVVLVVCAELCSLHLRVSSDPDQIVASAVFADGAAAALVTSESPMEGDQPFLGLDGFGTALTGDGEKAMDWTIGDEGFEMVLTAEVPRIVGREIRAAVENVAGDGGIEAVDAWAIHPGGRSILDRVQAGLGLTDPAMTASREVLREYGNMSSATVLFILQRLLADDTLADGARVVGIGFGPGLSVESGRFVRRVPSG